MVNTDRPVNLINFKAVRGKEFNWVTTNKKPYMLLNSAISNDIEWCSKVIPDFRSLSVAKLSNTA